MNTYPVNVFDVWPGDDEPVDLPSGPRVASLFPSVYERTCQELTWLAATVKTIAQQDDDEIFDQLYRRSHVLCGFATILELPKVAHLLTLLDVAFDYARDIETFAQGSLDYVVHLLIATVQEVFTDFHVHGHCARHLQDVVDECRTYLQPRLTHASPPVPRRDEPAALSTPAAPPTALTRVETSPPVPPVAAFSTPEVDDAPEELNIPIDKVGLVSDFCEECRENLGQIGYQLIALEDSDAPLPLVHDLFRAVHTIKAGARMVQIRKMETLSHELETLLDQVRQGLKPVSTDLITVLLEAKKVLESIVDEVASRSPIRTRIVPTFQALLRLQNGAALVPRPPITVHEPALAAEPPTPLPTAGSEAPPATTAVAPARLALAAESIRVPTDKLDNVLNIASEVFITRIRLQNDVAALRSVLHQFRQTLEQPHAFAVPAPVDAHGYSAAEESMLNLLALEDIEKRLQKDVEHLDQLSVRLQTGAMNFRMLPIAHLFDRFPTQIREMGQQVGKKVRLEVSGAETELDKVLVNQLADPLLHLLRNAVDHGIEASEERLACGKPEVGGIALRAYYHGSHAVIEVTDNGRGMNAEKILAKAIERGLVEPERAATLSQQDIFALIFAPGFSTAEQVSMLSGRGVGMDVVKTAMSQLQGTISIDSVPQRGTTVRLRVPLTLAVVGILLVEERFNLFAFPLLHVEEILTIEKHQIQRVSHNTVYHHRGQTLPVTTLSSILDFTPSAFADDKMLLVILAEGETKIGILVDRVLDRQEVLIKNLGSLIKKVPFVMGCTILSDSRLVLILNAWEIINSRTGQPLQIAMTPTTQHSTRRARTVLIVDDSLVQRKHLSAILSHAGYRAETAENGFEALKRLRHQHYAAFCVDITMPLMDGLEFAERLRHTPGYRDTPVLLITGRAGDQERLRAARLGVQALLEKPVNADSLIQTLDTYCLVEPSETRTLALVGEGA